MTPDDVLLMARGAGGVGCWTLNRNFVREFGTDATFILSDLLRAFTFGDRMNTNLNQWFIWNPNTMLSFCRWPEARLKRALDELFEADVFEMKRIDKQIMFKLNFDFLDEIGGALSLKESDHVKKVRQ